MGFSSGLSGIAAANKDLQITGNNVANASTVGFKTSRAEFGDAYTTTILGTGGNAIGSGVNVDSVAQKFTQGNISQTNSVFDLAIDGAGFFVLGYENGTQTYSRSGMFGVDKDGFITNNQGGKLQGFGTDENGIVTGILQDLKVETGNQPPKGTQGVEAQVNVSAGAQVLQQLGSITRTNGLAVGVAQVGQAEATSSVLSTLNVPTTEGTPSYLNTNINIADRLTAGNTGLGFSGVTPTIGAYQTPNTPNFNTTTGGAIVNGYVLGTPSTVAITATLSDSINISINTGGATLIEAEISPYTGNVSDLPSAIAGLQIAINNNEVLSGHVLVREDPNNLGQIELYSTDGTTFPIPAISIPSTSTSTLANQLGFGDSTHATLPGNDNSTNDNRILLDDLPLIGETIEVNYLDATGVAAVTPLTLTLAPVSQNYASQTALITDLNTQLNAELILAGLNGNEFVAQINPFNASAIEIVPNINDTITPVDEDYAISSIVNTLGSTLAQDLGLTSGSVSNRFFQNPPASSDTIQIQIQDPNINGGTPYTALIRPFPSEIPITNTAELLAEFQDQLNDDVTLSGRLTIQEDPDNAGVFQLISSSGTRITSVTDLIGSVATDLHFQPGSTITESVFSNLPPSITSTIDITLQGPNFNNGSQIIENIEPFPAGSVINNMNDMVAAFQSAIDGNQNLAGKIKVSEDPNRIGFLQVETFGPYATDGTNILSLSDNVGGMASLLGLDLGTVPNPTVNTAIAGLELFANGGSIDLTTIEGTPVTVQGNLPSEFIFNDFTPGEPSTLTGAALTLSPFTGNTGSYFNMNIVSGSNSDTITVNVPGGGFSSQADLSNAVAVAIAGSAQLNGVISVGVDSSNRMYLTNIRSGAQSISVYEAGSDMSPTFPNPVQDVLGMTAGSSPQPILELGSEDISANNELTLTVGGDEPGVGTIRIPGGTYTTTDNIVLALNGQITANPQLTGKVEASNVNGRIIFSLTQLGGFPNSLDVDSNGSSLAAFGHSSQSTPPAIDPVDRRNSFRVNLSVPLPDEDNRSGSVEVTLDENIRSIEQLASAINRELNAAEEDQYVGVRAEVHTNTDGTKTLNFVATIPGEASQISVTNVQAIGEDISEQEIYAMLQIDAYDENNLVTGEPEITNGYPEQSFVLYDEENDVRRSVTIPEDLQASQIASLLSELAGVKATAETELTIYSQDYINSGQMDILINDQRITANNFEDMVEEINQYQQTTLSGITADYDEESGNLMLHSTIGTDIKIQIDSTVATDTLTLRGVDGTAPAVLGGANNEETTALVGGFVDIVLNEGYTMIEPDPRVVGLFNGLTSNSFEDYVINSFNPDDPETYNDTASITMYDSLGTQHRLQMYFVKEPDDPQRPLDLNYWTVYAQVDGLNVGDPDPSLAYPDNLAPTMASHRMYYNADGTLDTESTGPWLISNWDPVDESGDSNGAFTSQNVAEGGSLPISTVSSSSNFEIDLTGSTQYGGPFSRANFQQDGYSSGRLKDLEVGDDGIIYARYTNGEAQVLGQVATASFQNVEGLTQMGHTEWQESFDSGDATIGEPGTGVLGKLRSSALEDSTVDLSEQLVHLIIAQRNYQASAKTIETANAVTQTIINLR
ncbi:flagellar hook-basal body complex protein [Marinicellulosiphila megalodicopiae]|uniref:flagellar hook-basal body complex protein n=1 Tax=Marinicellulosiphila megalodicopiae TaxID=2724896 RepID=UPI003BB12C10